MKSGKTPVEDISYAQMIALVYKADDDIYIKKTFSSQ